MNRDYVMFPQQLDGMTGNEAMTGKIATDGLKGVSETLMLTLYFRAVESQRPDALIHDAKAAELVERLDYDFTQLQGETLDQLFAIMRVREFDRLAQTFLAQHPDGTIVDIGCGLDTRFHRLDNGRLEWYGLDVPEVIELRRKLLEETSRSHFIAGSALDFGWMDHIDERQGRALLFLAEGVFPFFDEREVRRLVMALRERFPGSELVFDLMSPMFVTLHNLQLWLKGLRIRLRWGVRNAKDLESWGKGILLLTIWFYLDEPEPRLGRTRLLRLLPSFRSGAGIGHYRLGG